MYAHVCINKCMHMYVFINVRRDIHRTHKHIHRWCYRGGRFSACQPFFSGSNTFPTLLFQCVWDCVCVQCVCVYIIYVHTTLYICTHHIYVHTVCVYITYMYTLSVHSLYRRSCCEASARVRSCASLSLFAARSSSISPLFCSIAAWREAGRPRPERDRERDRGREKEGERQRERDRGMETERRRENGRWPWGHEGTERRRETEGR